MHELTLVIPAKYEAESLPLVLEEIFKVKKNILIKISLEFEDIDTINSLKKYDVEIFCQKKRGYGAALIEAINSVETEYFCIFNADGSFNPVEIDLQLNKIKTENLDFIFSSRYLKNASSEDDTIITYLGNKFFSTLGKFFFNLPISDILYTFVLGKTKNFKSIQFKQMDFSFCVELPILLFKNKMNIADLPSNERARIAGKKKVNALKDGFLILISMIKLLIKK